MGWDRQDLIFAFRAALLFLLGLVITVAFGLVILGQIYHGSTIPIIVMIIFGFFSYVLFYYKLKYIWEELVNAKSKRTFLMDAFLNRKKEAKKIFDKHKIRITEYGKEVPELDEGKYTAILDNGKKVLVELNRDYKKYSTFSLTLDGTVKNKKVLEIDSMVNAYCERAKQGKRLQIPEFGCKVSKNTADVEVLIPFTLDTLEDAIGILKSATKAK